MKASKISNNHNLNSNTLYEPTSVLDPHLTSSPASAAVGPTDLQAHFLHHNFSLPPPPSDDWEDPLSFFLDSSPFDLSPFDLDVVVDPPLALGPPPSSSSSFDRSHLDLLLKAAGAVESNDASTAHVILSRLNQIPDFGSSPLQRASFHFKDALLSLLPVHDPPTASPPPSPLEIVGRITAHKSFSDLSPVPQFTSFTANQTILESLLDAPSSALHVIDFDIGLGGQWSSFAQEIAARSKSRRCPPPQIRITAVVADETVETVLAAENLRDFARAIGVQLSVGFVHVGSLGTLALGRVRIVPGEAIAVVLTPTIFRLVGGAPEASAALMRFVRQASPRIVVFVDTECFAGSASFRRSFAGALEFYSAVLESVDAAAAGAAVGPAAEDGEVAARRIEEKVMRPRMFAAARTFTPTEVLGMVLSNLKGIAENNLNTAVVDCCIGIPVYFTDLQRRAVLDAATIAGLHPLRLFHETTATALAYGIYKTDLPENDQLNVAFVDIGHASMQVCIAGLKKGQLKILAHSFDRSLGGRDFDEVLFKHFAAKFKEEYKIDVYQNARACLRLRAACEKLKKVLSANPEAPLNIECLMDEKDVRGFIKREEFEKISEPILERVKRPLEKALVEAGLTVDNIHSVEVVGSGSRVPAVIKILTEFFGKEPRRTMNASECVARGCALQCAMLSPTFKVREFQVHESFPFSIALSWKGSAPDSQSETEHQQSTVVFPKGNPIPSFKALTFFRSSTFSIDVIYADASEVQLPSLKISTYTIGPFQSAKGERAKLKVKVRLNLHGIVSVESAIMLEEDEVEVPVTAGKEAQKEMVTDEAKADSAAAGTDVNMQDASGAGVENGVPTPESEDKPVQMETDAKIEPSKKKVKKTNVQVVEVVYGGLAPADLQKAVEKEFEMALQDRVMEETKDKKNAVEAYVYDMRNKLHDKYAEFVTPGEREELTAKLQEVEDWLYEDGEDEAKGVYVAKLDELKKQGDPIEERYKEWTERGPASDQLSYCINSYREAALSNDPKFGHIDLAEKQKVINECGEAEAWIREKKQQQDALPKHANPVLLSADVKRKSDTLDRFCRHIMTKPKPSPAKSRTQHPAEAASPQPEATEQQPQEDSEQMAEESGQGAAPEAADPMEMEKPEGTPSAAA